MDFTELEIELSSTQGDESYRVELRFKRFDDSAEYAPIAGIAHLPLTFFQQELFDDVYGQHLCDRLFADARVLDYYKSAWEITQALGATLRLRLLIDAQSAQLHHLHWETLRDPFQKSTLLSNEHVLFSRLVGSTNLRPIELRHKAELRTLIVIANPSDIERYKPGGRPLAPLDALGELARTQQSLEMLHTDTLVSDPTHPGRVTLPNVIDKLRNGYEILYLVCHGALLVPAGKETLEPYIWLEKEDGTAEVVKGTELVERLRDLSVHPQLIVLASCQSADSEHEPHTGDEGVLSALGPQLVEMGIPAVIAMQGSVSIETVSRWTPVFFRELLRDGQLEQAMAAARSMVLDRLDWWMPVLFLRLRDGRLWLNVAQDGTDQQSHPSLWMVPYRRNPFFTGRETVLHKLHDRLSAKGSSFGQIQAMSGLGGIGKTQIALEYAYRYRSAYSSVFWMRAASYDTLLTDFMFLAQLLQVPECNEQEQARVVTGVQRWLATQNDYLLILDNADDVTIVETFLLSQCTGHILLTTQADFTGGLVDLIAIEEMEREEGILLLLRRAGYLRGEAVLEQARPEDRAEAEALVTELGGIPLAIDQAGAYLEETRTSLANYHALYHSRRRDLLKRRSGGGTHHSEGDHPESVAATWSLSFQQIEQINVEAADILRLCAFLAPDAIPEELFSEGVRTLPIPMQSLANPLVFDNAITVLRTYSLLKRDPSMHVLWVHRLVQTVLKDELDESAHRLWEERVVQMVATTFPNVEHNTWQQCERCLEQALLCVRYLEQPLNVAESAHLLQRTGWYLAERGRYQEAAPLLNLALTISERGKEQMEIARDTATLGWLYQKQGEYEQAEPLLQRALAIYEQKLGPTHLNLANSLDNLADLYQEQGKYGQAESLYQRAMVIKEQELGPTDPHTASTLDNLADLYQEQGKYGQAEALIERALTIREQELGPTHPHTADSLEDLAQLYQGQGKYEQAEPLIERALTIREQKLGPTHPLTADGLNNLAELYREQGKYEQAEPLYQRALAIYEQKLGPSHPHTADGLNNLAELYREQNKYEQAEPLYQRALAIYEQKLGPTHPHTVVVLLNLANMYEEQGLYEQAKQIYQRAIEIDEQIYGANHHKVATDLEGYSRVLRTLKLDQEAAQLEARVKEIRAEQSS